jgi:alcohol dehydrogenase class IV
MIRAGAASLGERGPRRLVAIGRGSVMDWARLAWAESQGLLDEAGASAALRSVPRAGPELWLVPTTCATGAEATGVAVFSGKDGVVPVLTPPFVADRVVLDGGYRVGVDAARDSLWLCDALSHAVEAFLSIVPDRLASSLEADHPGAAASVREGLEETLTLQGLGIEETLYRKLRSTNAIENLNSGIANYSKNVKRWQGGSMVVRWVSAAIAEAEKKFRRVQGWRDIEKLSRALARRCRLGRIPVI